jgi:hypothetical protein
MEEEEKPSWADTDESDAFVFSTIKESLGSVYCSHGTVYHCECDITTSTASQRHKAPAKKKM